MSRFVVSKEMVFDEIKRRNNGCTVPELESDLGWNHEVVRRRLVDLMEEGAVERELITDGKVHAFRYTIVNHAKKEADMEKPERYGDNKNDEGYPDPTFAKAIKNLDRFNDIMPGGIYGTSLGVGDSFLVVRTYPDCALGYYVREVDLAKSTDTTTAWQTKKGTSYVQVNQLMSVPFRKLDKHKFERMPLDAYKDIIRKSPLQTAKVAPVEIEKIIEKEVPVEKEVIKAVPAALTIEGCYEFLRDSGWLDEHDKAVKDIEKAKYIFGAPTELTEDICIEFLQNSGWLPEHDKEMTTVTSAIPKEVVNEMLKLELLKQKASIYEEILKIVLPGFKK